LSRPRPDEFRRLIEVNLLGQAYGARAALPHLRRAGGALIHVSSVEAQRAMPYHSAYAASKHGVHGFVQTLRMELAHEDVPIRVVEILPPSINTPLFTTARTKIGVQPRPLPPVYPPELVTEAILRAAERPVTREIVLGGVGKQMLLGQRLSPRLMDALMGRIGFPLQETDQPKNADAPDNLYTPVAGQDRIEGDFSGEAKWEATAPWLERNKWLVVGTAAAAVGAVVLARPRRGGPRPGSSGSVPPRTEDNRPRPCLCQGSSDKVCCCS
jgi:hypothetical protein